MSALSPSAMNPNNRQPFDVQRNKYNTEKFRSYTKEILNIGVGAPGPELLEHCAANFSKATEHLLKKDAIDHDVFRYGQTTGSLNVRVNVAKFLSEGYGRPVDYRDLVMTAGSSHALHLVLTALIDMNGVIFVDELTYKHTMSIFNNFDKMRIVIVPWKDNQPDISALNALVEDYKFESKTKMFWGVYYIIPIYHNPTSVCFTEDICKRLLALSIEHNLLIACDDVQALLSYKSGMPLKRLYAYDNDPSSPGTVISMGSFSKILAPSVRVGWMECPPRCVEAFNNCGGLVCGNGICTYTSGIISSLIELGLAQEQLAIYQTAYKERMSIACKLLHENLPANCSFDEPAGGFFLWVRMPDHCDAEEFCDLVRSKHNIFILPSILFSVRRIIRNNFRICIGYPTSETLAIAIPILCDALREFCNSE